MVFSYDTIIAPATAVGAGAVNLVRISGSRAFELVDSVVKLKRGTAGGSKGWTVHYGEVFEEDGALLDQVVVSLFRGPHSYTGEDCAEICCHASSYIVSRLLELLSAAGARLAEGGEFTRRAYLNGKMDLAEAEAVADVIAASSKAAHRIAVNQLRGGYSAQMRELRDALLELSALVELELDFSEEDVEFADRSKLRELIEASMGKIGKLRDSFRVGNALKNGVPVAIVGEPNSGKSTLLNAILGEDRAIVSPVAGTTRDTVEETFTHGGVLYRFIDTAGLRETSDLVESIGVKRAYDAASKAEIILGVVDSSLPDASSQMSALRALCTDGQHFIEVWNKADLAARSGETSNDNLPGAASSDSLTASISAKSGHIDEVLSAIDECGFSARSEDTIVSSQRHHEALRSAYVSLGACLHALDASIPTDLLAEDLRAAVASFNEIIGERTAIDVETVLGTVFSRFCIGK